MGCVVKKQKCEGKKLTSTSVFFSFFFFFCAYKTVTDEDEEEINSDIFKVKLPLMVGKKLPKVAVCTKQ